ncbi:MAG: hypothetical protein Q7T33_07775 [Dehalococcoidia bacterium]|nr:hypothetical protein [Dehalococcoidia bacterium]
MFTENGVMIDLDEVRKVVDRCDVFTIGFRTFGERLIVDTRTQGEEGPMAEVVGPVGTVEERFFWLGQRRPAFGVPQQFTFFVWPHSLRFFRECGLVELIGGRLQAPQLPAASGGLDQALQQLDRLEHKATLDAIRGNNYHTLWASGAQV